MAKGNQYDILGLGSPILDTILRVDDTFLEQVPGKKGSWASVELNVIAQLVKNYKDTPTVIAGGSCSNTIKGLAHLGRRCALTGKIGADPEAGKFIRYIQSLGITPLYSTCATPTAQVLCLVSPDGERTMLSYPGAGTQMRPEDLNAAMFEGVKLVHIEGYSLLVESLTQRTMELAKAAGAKVSFDLASFEITQAYKETIINLLARYVDVVFANIHETRALTHLGPEKGCMILKDLCETAVVLMGREGCWVGYQHDHILCPAFAVVPLDTTGAGDVFASGFLHGMLEGHSVEECARYGALAGSAVVQVIGAELPPEKWDLIRKESERS